MDTSLQAVREMLEAGRGAGLTSTGVASCRPSDHGAHLRAWLARGAHAGMEWMERNAAIRLALRTHWDWAHTAFVATLSYLSAPLDRTKLRGVARYVSRYARGADYHDLLKDRLRTWGDAIERIAGGPVRRIALVDTSPVLEREMAWRAGLGWFGKNTCLIGPQGDSWRFVGILLVDMKLMEEDGGVVPAAAPLLEMCGSCRACLDACPTDAIPEPWFVDANRCLSYWTIEHRGTIPPEFAGAIGDWLFGCDVCQEVCPWNRKAPAATGGPFSARPALESTSLASLLRKDEPRFRAAFRGTAMFRPHRPTLVRNALLVAHGQNDLEALAEAPRLRDEDPDPVVRETARDVLERGAATKS